MVLYSSSKHVLSINTSLYESKAHTDFVIVAGRKGKRLHVHKAILCASSEFFRVMFKKCEEQEVTIDYIKPKILEAMIKYLYLGVIEIDDDSALDFGQAAYFLKIPKVIAFTLDFITDDLTADNCLEFWYMARAFEEKEMEKRALNVAVEKFEEVIFCEKFTKLEFDSLEIYLDVAHHTVSEDKFAGAILDWINFDNSDRSKYFGKLLYLIDVSLINCQDLVRQLKARCTEPDHCQYLSSSLKRRDLFKDTFSFQRGTSFDETLVAVVTATNQEQPFMVEFDTFAKRWFVPQIEIHGKVIGSWESSFVVMFPRLTQRNLVIYKYKDSQMFEVNSFLNPQDLLHTKTLDNNMYALKPNHIQQINLRTGWQKSISNRRNLIDFTVKGRRILFLYKLNDRTEIDSFDPRTGVWNDWKKYESVYAFDRHIITYSADTKRFEEVLSPKPFKSVVEVNNRIYAILENQIWEYLPKLAEFTVIWKTNFPLADIQLFSMRNPPRNPLKRSYSAAFII